MLTCARHCSNKLTPFRIPSQPHIPTTTFVIHAWISNLLYADSIYVYVIELAGAQLIHQTNLPVPIEIAYQRVHKF